MSYPLQDLVDLVTLRVPTYNTSPTPTEVGEAVKQAVGIYNDLASRLRVSTLDLVADVEEYALPTGFVSFQRLESPVTDGGVVVTDAGIIPQAVSTTYLKGLAYYTTSTSLIFVPAPTFSLSGIRLWYKFGHFLSEGTYEEMTETEALLIALKAQSLILANLATLASRDAWRYSLGAESVSKEQLSASMLKASEELDKQFNKQVSDKNSTALGQGPFGIRGKYTAKDNPYDTSQFYGQS